MAAKKKKKTARRKANPSLIDSMLKDADAEIGEGFAQVLGSDENLLKIRGVLSTQCPSLDRAIGRGGIPLGRLTILHGGEGSGKTTLALHLACEAQRLGGSVIYIDKEYKLDPEYALTLGVNTKRLLISQPDTLEQTAKILKTFLATIRKHRLKTGERKPVMIVLDSINACQSKETIENEEGKRQYPNEARIWSKELPEIIKLCSKEDVALVFISQVRQKLNVMYGDDEEIAGGKSPKFHASLILGVKRIGYLTISGKRFGNKMEVTCKKNQIFKPFEKAQFLIRYGHGIDFEDSLLAECEDAGIVKRRSAARKKTKKKTGKGQICVFRGHMIGKGGREAIVDIIREDEELREEMVEDFRAQWAS